ncbi:hypothetical protein D3C72_1913020 [compost metagenome]
MPHSVWQAFEIGVRKLTRVSARSRSPASSAWWATSIRVAACRASRRLPSTSDLMVSSMRRTSGCTRIGSAGLSGNLAPLSERDCRRSRLYFSAFW